MATATHNPYRTDAINDIKASIKAMGASLDNGSLEPGDLTYIATTLRTIARYADTKATANIAWQDADFDGRHDAIVECGEIHDDLLPDWAQWV